MFALAAERSDVIRAVAYINAEWNAQQMWGSGANGYWGDSRVEANALVQGRWLAEIRKELWLHGGPDLFSLLIRP